MVNITNSVIAYMLKVYRPTSEAAFEELQEYHKYQGIDDVHAIDLSRFRLVKDKDVLEDDAATFDAEDFSDTIEAALVDFPNLKYLKLPRGSCGAELAALFQGQGIKVNESAFRTIERNIKKELKLGNPAKALGHQSVLESIYQAVTGDFPPNHKVVRYVDINHLSDDELIKKAVDYIDKYTKKGKKEEVQLGDNPFYCHQLLYKIHSRGIVEKFCQEFLKGGVAPFEKDQAYLQGIFTSLKREFSKEGRERSHKYVEKYSSAFNQVMMELIERHEAASIPSTHTRRSGDELFVGEEDHFFSAGEEPETKHEAVLDPEKRILGDAHNGMPRQPGKELYQTQSETAMQKALSNKRE